MVRADTVTGRSGDQREGSRSLVERADNLASIERRFDAARHGQGSTVAICGPAGIGKTTLIQTFLAGLDDATVFMGGCDDLIAPRSFGPFRDMARSSGLLPDDLIRNPNREDLLAGLLDVLDRPTRPAIMVVEDVHWADDASIDILRYLTRRIVSMHAMLIITLRDREVDRSHPVRNLLTGPTSTAPTRIELHPLSVDAVARMVRDLRSTGVEPGLDPRSLHEVSGGNPYLVGQLLGAGPGDAARSARETLVARSERLSPGGQAVLHSLSVLPEGADPTVARMLFGDQTEALHEAEGSGLLESTNDRIRFRHELGRTAVVQSMSFGERMAATNQVLDALINTGADPTLLVHLSRSAGDGRRATRFALEVLDDGLAPTNHREIWKLTRIALECTTDLPPDRIASLHQSAATAGRLTNNHDEAVRHAEKAVELLTDLGRDGGPLATAWLTVATTRASTGDHHRAAAALHRAKELLDQEPVTEEWIHCNTLLAASALIGGETEESIERTTESIELAESNGWTQAMVYALGLRGVARGGPVFEEGLADMDRAVRLGARHGPPDRHAANLHNLSVLYLRNADTTLAEEAIDEAERYAREHGLDNMVFHSQVQRAHILIQHGRMADAETLLNDSLERAGDPGAIRASATAALARIWARRGDPAATDLIEQCWLDAVATGEIQKIGIAGIARLEYLWLQGDDESLQPFAHHLAGLGERHNHHRLRADALRTLQRLGADVEPFDGCPPPLAAALAGDHRLAAER
ncbi:MAG: AAA family ATPase, partial [Actinomycetota bacterium]